MAGLGLGEFKQKLTHGNVTGALGSLAVSVLRLVHLFGELARIVQGERTRQPRRCGPVRDEILGG